MKDNMDKSLFFITLSAVCVWLIVDKAVGKDYLGSFLQTVFPFMADSGGGSTAGSYSPDLSTGTLENAPSSSAAGSNNDKPYGANRP